MILYIFFCFLYVMPQSIFSAAASPGGKEFYDFLQKYPTEESCLEYVTKHPLSKQDLLYAHSITGSTLLMRVAGLGYCNLFESILAKNASPNVIDKNGASVLGYATSKLAIAKEDPAYVQQIAAAHKIIDILLAQPNINLEIADKWGNTPLITAAKANHHDLVKKLVVAGANRQASNYHNETALAAAQRKGYEEIVTCLQQAASRIDEPFFESSDSSD